MAERVRQLERVGPQVATRRVPPRWGRFFSRTLPQTLGPRLLLILFCIFFVIPFYWMATSAFKTTAELSNFPPTLFPKALDFTNFVKAITVVPFPTFFLNSVILTTGIAVGSAISNPLIAYGFSRLKWPGRDVMFGLVMATIFVPYPALIVALFDIFAKLGWINTFLPMIVPAFFGQPFFIFLMRQFFMGLPMEVSEAARIDGANEFQIFLYIIMPLARPAVAVVIIFSAVAAWGEFLAPLLYLQEETKYPLSIGLQFYRQEHDVAYNLLMAASTLIVLPIVALFLAFQRFFIEGVTVGSVKG